MNWMCVRPVPPPMPYCFPEKGIPNSTGGKRESLSLTGLTPSGEIESNLPRAPCTLPAMPHYLQNTDAECCSSKKKIAVAYASCRKCNEFPVSDRFPYRRPKKSCVGRSMRGSVCAKALLAAKPWPPQPLAFSCAPSNVF